MTPDEARKIVEAYADDDGVGRTQAMRALAVVREYGAADEQAALEPYGKPWRRGDVKAACHAVVDVTRRAPVPVGRGGRAAVTPDQAWDIVFAAAKKRAVRGIRLQPGDPAWALDLAVQHAAAAATPAGQAKPVISALAVLAGHDHIIIRLAGAVAPQQQTIQ